MIRRRWLQFSLRSLLVAMFVVAIWPAYRTNRLHRQRLAIEAIEKKGGEVVILADGTIDYVFMPYVRAEDLQPLLHLNTARSVKMTGGLFDTSMTPITELRNVERVTLFNMKVTSDGLRLLASLPHLRYLTFDEVKFDDQDVLGELFDCTGLSEVTFYETKVVEKQLKELAEALPACQVWVASDRPPNSISSRSRIITP